MSRRGWSRAGADRKTFVLGVGAQKAGTTWLHGYLSNSRHCARGYRKEYHVFDYKDLPSAYWRKRTYALAQDELEHLRLSEPSDGAPLHRASMIADHRFYFDYFAGLLWSKPHARFTADVTPEYALLSTERLAEIRDSFAARRVRTVVIFLMRDPVDRIWSQIRMQEARRPGRHPERADKMIERLFTRPLIEKWSHYEQTIRNVDAVFGPDDVHYGFFEELFTNDQQLREICRVIGIPFREPNFERHANVSAARAVEALPDEIVATVAKHLHETYATVAARFPNKDFRTMWPSSRFVL